MIFSFIGVYYKNPPFYLQLQRSQWPYIYINDAVTNNADNSTSFNCLEWMWINAVKICFASASLYAQLNNYFYVVV